MRIEEEIIADKTITMTATDFRGTTATGSMATGRRSSTRSTAEERGRYNKHWDNDR